MTKSRVLKLRQILLLITKKRASLHLLYSQIPFLPLKKSTKVVEPYQEVSTCLDRDERGLLMDEGEA